MESYRFTRQIQIVSCSNLPHCLSEVFLNPDIAPTECNNSKLYLNFFVVKVHHIAGLICLFVQLCICKCTVKCTTVIGG